MKPEAFDNIYFIGIGGIGMSTLARYFAAEGKQVAGYDRMPSPITDALQKEGMPIHFEDDPEQIPTVYQQETERSLLIYTPAIPSENRELNHFMENGYTLYKRSTILGLISQDKFTIAVGGAHGKTSTCAFIAHLLRQAGIDFYGFLGGIATNYETNFLAPEEKQDTPILLAEADEYDRSFLQLTPDITVLTSTDADHLDIYDTHQALLAAYDTFAAQTKQGGRLVYNAELKLPKQFPASIKKVSFSLNKGDWHARNVQVANHRYAFELIHEGEKTSIQCGVPGEHNVLNMIAGCAALGNMVGDASVYQEATATFKGVKRRFEYILDEPEVVFVDDYAHHPRELDYTIKTLKKLYPEEAITGIFQPHLYSRTRDFAEDFALALSQLDRVVLLPVYPAREEPIAAVSSRLILDYMAHTDKHLLEKTQIEDFISRDTNKVLTTLGAGDIDRLVQPIHTMLEKTRLS